MQSVWGSTRALACSDRRPRRSVPVLAAVTERWILDGPAVFREGAENRTRGRVRSQFQLHRSALARIRTTPRLEELRRFLAGSRTRVAGLPTDEAQDRCGITEQRQHLS
jgi:hypothetical protein